MDESMNQEGILATCSGEDVTKVELNEIKEHVVDVDAIISEEERQLVYESLIHEKEGKLIPLTEFKTVFNPYMAFLTSLSFFCATP